MTQKINNFKTKVTAFLFMLLMLSGCNLSFHDIGTPPALSSVNVKVPINDVVETAEPEVIRGPERISMTDNTLWNKRNGIYFRDTRAYEVGDILTVSISMNDNARFKNRSERDGSINGSLTGAGTFSWPSGLNPAASINGSLNAKSGAERGGTVNRSESINLRIAAVVIAASPNGNLQISGSQEVRVNHELRILTVQGVVRSKDILPDNTIPYEKIAEARISYGGANTRLRREVRWTPSRLPAPLSYKRTY